MIEFTLDELAFNIALRVMLQDINIKKNKMSF